MYSKDWLWIKLLKYKMMKTIIEIRWRKLSSILIRKYLILKLNLCDLVHNWRVLGPSNLLAGLEEFRILELSKSESLGPYRKQEVKGPKTPQSGKSVLGQKIANMESFRPLNTSNLANGF